MKKQQIITALVLFCVLVASRLIPHPQNFTALIGVALFSGTFWGQSANRGLGLRFAIPLAATLVTDIVLGFYPGMEWTYLGIAAGVVLAPKISASIFAVSLRAFIASVVFFIFSNIGVWWSSGLYTQDTKGLSQCFIMAIPFFQNTVASGFLFSIALFSVYRLAFFERGFKGFVVAEYGR